MLYNVATTEPGVIPSPYLNSGIANETNFKINKSLEYYCEYQSKKELADTMAENLITNSTQKFFSALKYKYLPLVSSEGSSRS